MNPVLNSIYIFDDAGMLLFHHDLTPVKSDPKLVGAFLSAIDQWAKMYSDTGVSLFITGATKFMFERSIYAKTLVFCIAATHDQDDGDLREKVQVVRENFIHVFWEDLTRFQRGGISVGKLDRFKELVLALLKKK